MIEIIITPSKKSDKKFDATIDGKKKLCPLVHQSILILRSMDQRSAKMPTYNAIRLEKTGTILQELGHYVKTYCGINKAYQQV